MSGPAFNMNLYDEFGWLDMPKILGRPYNFSIICHGRGTGKTYGAVKWTLDNKIPHIYLRRTGPQIDQITRRPEFNPYYKLDPLVCFGKGDGLRAIYHGEQEGDKIIPSGAPLGYVAALSKVANMRGFSGEFIDFIFYDEFIRKKQEKRFPGEDDAFLDFYESVAHNREIEGKGPLRCLLAANSDNMANEIFLRLRLVTIAERMRKTGAEVYEDNKRSLALYIPHNSPISEKKKDTALYKLLGTGDSYAEMSTENEFNKEDFDNVRSLSLQPYNLNCVCGEIAVYKHKSDNTYYISEHVKGSAPVYGVTDIELKRFTIERYYLWLAYLRRRVIFESYIQKLLFEKYFMLS